MRDACPHLPGTRTWRIFGVLRSDMKTNSKEELEAVLTRGQVSDARLM